jgi:glyoxylase-like metal-dependent hydrolase (beta-lactamase superfamily II)
MYVSPVGVTAEDCGTLSFMASAPLPPVERVRPGVWSIPVPIPNNPLRYVLVYAFETDAGVYIVDAGWNTDEAFDTLAAGLTAVGASVADVRGVMITHIHPDHYGLAGRLREICSADLSFHRLERLYIESRYADADELLAEMREWLRLNGTPVTELDRLNRASMRMLDRVQIAFPDRTLDGGEEITSGAFAFRVIWTPGHSAGHICLFDGDHKILLSGDHVLPHITPAVGLHVRTTSNPLADYLDSLALIGSLQAELVLPGHGEPFRGLPERTAAMIAHHQGRLDEILSMLAASPEQRMTGYAIAARMHWSRRRGWDDLSDFERRLAVTEALAHIELLHARGSVRKRFTEGEITYFVSES